MKQTALAVADLPEFNLSSARRALTDHVANVGRAKADLERATKPAARLREQLRVANEQLAAAEADLAAVDAQHASAMRDQARSGIEITSRNPPASANEEAALERARRTVNAIRAALTECEGEVRTASSVLRDAEAQLDPLLLAVMNDEFEEALQDHRQTYNRFIESENEIRGMLDAIATRGRALLGNEPERGRAWLQGCERMVLAHGKMPADVGDFRPASARWTATLTRLATDASAR